MLFEHVAIESLGYVLAPHRIPSEWLEDQIAETMQRLRIAPGQIVGLSGIRERRFWDPGTPVADVATLAARQAIEAAGIDPQELGCLINASVCQDYLEPATAVFVHGNLGLGPHCANFDMRNACLGFLDAMVHIGMLIECEAIKYGIVVDGEGSQDVVMVAIERLKSPAATMRDFVNAFATLTLGSGGVAMVLAHRSVSRSGHRLNGGVSMADTSQNHLCRGTATSMETDSGALLTAGVRLAEQTWRKAGALLPNWQREQIKLYIPHQVGQRHMEAVARALGVPVAGLHLNFQVLGNIGPAAVPITLAQAVEAGRIQPGDHVGLLGIGSGINCSMMSVTW